jgi:hypothetical protein
VDNPKGAKEVADERDVPPKPLQQWQRWMIMHATNSDGQEGEFTNGGARQ